MKKSLKGEFSIELTEEQKKIIKKATGDSAELLTIREYEDVGKKGQAITSIGLVTFGKAPAPRVK